MEWYEPDDRWEVWGIKSKEEFVDKFVVPGKFHGKVPADVVEAFKTVTYLMAHAYYYYPIYDEAMSKALLIMEMAIKLKAEELNISLKLSPNKKGDVYDKKLYKIIEEVCEYEHLKFLGPELNRARYMRNFKMHQRNYSIYGALGYTHRNVMFFVNIINTLFLKREELNCIKQKTNQINKWVDIFNEGLSVLEYAKGRIFVNTIYKFKYFKENQKELLLLFVQPVLIDVKSAVENYDHTPLVLGLNTFILEDDNLLGSDIDGNPVKIYPSSKLENLVDYKNYMDDWETIARADQDHFTLMMAREALWRFEELMYNNCWN